MAKSIQKIIILSASLILISSGIFFTNIAFSQLVSSADVTYDYIIQSNLRAVDNLEKPITSSTGNSVAFLVDLTALGDSDQDYDFYITSDDFKTIKKHYSGTIGPWTSEIIKVVLQFDEPGTYQIDSYLLRHSEEHISDKEEFKRHVKRGVTDQHSHWEELSINFQITGASTPEPEPDTITISTDKTNYNTGEIIRVSGKTNEGFTQGTVILKGPLGNLLILESFNSGADGSYEMNLNTNWFLRSGTYVLSVTTQSLAEASLSITITAESTPEPEPDTITISTDKTNYNTGEIIRVSGKNNQGLTQGTVFLKDPLGNLPIIEGFVSRADGSYEMNLDTSWFPRSGTYVLSVTTQSLAEASLSITITVESTPEPEPMPFTQEFTEYAIIQTRYGDITIGLNEGEAPRTVANFKKLGCDGFYDGTIFHRIIPGFMIQGGDPNTISGSRDMWGTGDPGYFIDAEFNDIKHKRGIVSMARAADVNSAGSQFFIVHQDSNFLDGEYTVFGKVTDGLDVVDKIAALGTNSQNQPLDQSSAKMIKVKIITIRLASTSEPWVPVCPDTSSEPTPTISVMTDDNKYKEGDTIKISGKVTNPSDALGVIVSVTVIAPNGNIMSIQQTTLNAFNAFSTEISAGGPLMKAEGIYTVTSKYGNIGGPSDSASFSFEGSVETEPTLEPKPIVTISDYNRNAVVSWIDDQVDDEAFIGTIHSIFENDSVLIPLEPPPNPCNRNVVVGWFKQPTEFWVAGQISDIELANSISYLVGEGVISSESLSKTSTDNIQYITLDKNSYTVTERATIKIDDPCANKNKDKFDFVPFKMYFEGRFPNDRTLYAFETGPDTGIFEREYCVGAASLYDYNKVEVRYYDHTQPTNTNSQIFTLATLFDRSSASLIPYTGYIGSTPDKSLYFSADGAYYDSDQMFWIWIPETATNTDDMSTPVEISGCGGESKTFSARKTVKNAIEFRAFNPIFHLNGVEDGVLTATKGDQSVIIFVKEASNPTTSSVTKDDESLSIQLDSKNPNTFQIRVKDPDLVPGFMDKLISYTMGAVVNYGMAAMPGYGPATKILGLGSDLGIWSDKYETPGDYLEATIREGQNKKYTTVFVYSDFYKKTDIVVLKQQGDESTKFWSDPIKISSVTDLENDKIIVRYGGGHMGVMLDLS